jgi:type II secretory pathway pseudopilin PulG
LIEIMVSVAILSFGLILILQGFTHSLNALRISENNLKANLLAEERIAQLQINARQGTDALLRDLHGQTSFDNIKYKWETEVAADERYEDLHKVLTIISWEEGRRKGSIPIATYLRIPLNEQE